MRVLIQNEVINYLDELIFILYKDEYFSYLENAENYVLNIYDYIEKYIPLDIHKKSPEKLNKFGSFYIFYNSNPRTTWFIFFNKKDEKYIVTHISNNHHFDANKFND
jgi:hypothetical protein